MTTGININIDISRLQEIRVLLNATPRHAEQALVSTCNRMANWLKTQIRRQLMGWARIPGKVIRKRIVRTRVRTRGGVIGADVFVGQNDASLIHFQARQNRTGVTSRRGSVAGGFIAKAGGKKHAFKRVGDARLPIKKLLTEIDPDAQRAISSVLSGGAFENEFYRRFQHEITWRMNRRPR